MTTVKRGFYVHYKGGIYYVRSVAFDMDEEGEPLVLYDSVQSSETDSSRYRKQSEFIQQVDTRNGNPYTENLPNIYVCPRFQRIVGWTRLSYPLVRGELSGEPTPFGTFYRPEST
jgi:hypothetical protein